MHLPLIVPADLTPEQKAPYDDMRRGISSNFNAFKAVRDDGALMGPWNPWLHEPGIGNAIWDLTLAMTANAWPITFAKLSFLLSALALTLLMRSTPISQSLSTRGCDVTG